MTRPAVLSLPEPRCMRCPHCVAGCKTCDFTRAVTATRWMKLERKKKEKAK